MGLPISRKSLLRYGLKQIRQGWQNTTPQWWFDCWLWPPRPVCCSTPSGGRPRWGSLGISTTPGSRHFDPLSVGLEYTPAAREKAWHLRLQTGTGFVGGKQPGGDHPADGTKPLYTAESHPSCSWMGLGFRSCRCIFQPAPAHQGASPSSPLNGLTWTLGLLDPAATGTQELPHSVWGSPQQRSRGKENLSPSNYSSVGR